MSEKEFPFPRPATADVFDPLEEPAAFLALAVPAPRGPSPRVKAVLLARACAAKRTEPRPPGAGWRFAAVASDEGWVALPFPGVRMRVVTVDAARDTALVYVEMEPGAVFPDHDHTADERGLVLTGDLAMAGRQLDAGDFYEAAAGTRHECISSRSGCTGLLWLGARAWRQWREKIAAT
ncbi:MAG: cupin domain-containing protein [Verrucomicrobia bacterium]|nr:cupin domain-containing protein [Verrucomicrobiota bacterium]